MGDPNRQHAQKQNEPPGEKRAEQPELGSKVAPTSAGQAQQIVESTRATETTTPGLAVPTRIDLGDHAVGTAHRDVLQLFNTESLDAYIHVRYEGSPGITIESAPERLRPVHDGVDSSAVVHIVFSPTKKGHTRGTLIVQAGWQNGVRAPQEYRVQVEAAAHEERQPDLAEEEAEQHARDEKNQADTLRHAEMQKSQKAADERLEKNVLPGTEAARERLRVEANKAQGALDRLIMNRTAGVDTACSEAVKYSKESPAHHESLLAQLAWAALDIASGSIASQLGKLAERALGSSVKIAEHTLPSGNRAPEAAYTPNEAIVGFFADAFKDTATNGGKAGLEALRADQAAPGAVAPASISQQPTAGSMSSTDPLLEFFQLQKTSLIGEVSHRAADVGDQVAFALEPMLDKHPKEAIASMKAIGDAIDAASMKKEVSDVQAQASAMQWIDYVAQTSLGTVAAEDARTNKQRTREDDAPTTRIEGANVAPDSRGAPAPSGGLINVEFEADIVNAAIPATFTSVRVEGISNATASRLHYQSLRETNLPVRAYGKPAGANAVIPLEVIRDEVGNIRYSDETGAPGMPGNWFARKAGEPNGGADAEARGARKLMEQEILSAPMKSVSITTDSTDGHKK